MTTPRILGLVPARGGSKRLPGKNLLPLAGRPLIAHTIGAARACKAIERVVVTTDDPSIAEASREAGAEVPFLRPQALSTDAATSLDVVLHALDWLRENDGYAPDAVMLLQPTSPLRRVEHLDAAIVRWRESGVESALISVTAARPLSWLYVLNSGQGLAPLYPKGEAPELAPGATPVLPNGAIYLAAESYLRRHGGFAGPATYGFPMSPLDSVDVDTAEDFALAQALAASRLA